MISFGIDIGGTFTKIIVINKKGRVLKSDTVKTPIKLCAKDFLIFLSDIIKLWCKELKIKKSVIGIGIAGDTDYKKGILRFAPNIPWNNLKIAEGLKKLTGFKTFVSNDANMATFGIYKKEFKNCRNIIALTLGTGIGGGIIIDGKLYQGSTGTAGEFGHTKIIDTKKGNLCACGARGCLESLIGTNNLKKLTLEGVKKNQKSILASLIKKEGFSVKLLSLAAEKQDLSALEIWHFFGTCLGTSLANLVLIFNPEVIVLSGGVSGGAKYFLPSLKKVLREEKIKEPFKNLKISISKTKNIGALGAALYALNEEDEK